MDSPADFLDEDEAVFPCKGCGEILEEGKAFELGRSLNHIPTPQSSFPAFQSAFRSRAFVAEDLCLAGFDGLSPSSASSWHLLRPSPTRLTNLQLVIGGI
jgi:hypothetical protein